MWRICILIGTLAIAACAKSPLDGLQPGEQGRVVRILSGDSFVLSTGLSVRLVGLEAPAVGRGDDPAKPYGAESRRALEDLIIGRQVQLYYAGLTRDRYDRALAHVRTIDRLGPKVWVNRHMVEIGAARVRTWPDTSRLAGVLLAAEVDARDEAAGLWDVPAYEVPDAGELATDVGGFVLVTGLVAGPVPTDRPGQLCALSMEGGDFRVIADRSAPQLCQLDPGDRIRLRGYASRQRLYINHDLNIERLEAREG